MDNLKKLVADILNIDILEVNYDLTRDENENWDSFGHLLLVSELESKLGIKFTMNEIENIKNYNNLEETVKKKVN